MASPDASPYVDLRLFDRSAQQIFEAALDNHLSYAPEWVPREGHQEVVLLEGLAIEVEDAVFAVNRLPGAITEVLLRLYQIERDLGSPPVAQLRFNVVDATGHTIPAETAVAIAYDEGDEALTFTTSAPLVIAPGQSTGVVTAYGVENTPILNGTLPGTYVELLDSVSVVDSVVLDDFIAGGASEEADEDWFTRGVQRFARLSETLVLPRHFTAAALEETTVSRAFTIDNYNPSVGPPGSNAGHVTVAVYGDGAALDAPTKAALQARFDEQAQANLAVYVVDPTINTVPVTVTVVRKPAYTSAEVIANVKAAVAAYLSPEQWAWSATVYRNELIALIDGVTGVERVTTITAPAADVALTGVAPLARAGTVTVTVT